MRILVYGNLIADGTLCLLFTIDDGNIKPLPLPEGQPIRFKPINATEASEQRGQQGTRYRLRRTPLGALHKGLLEMTRRHRRRLQHLASEWRHLEFSRWRQRRNTLSAAKPGRDDVFRQFPELRRENPQLQRFFVFLMENGTLSQAKGFLHFYNSTSGEIVPSCDRHFTLRNAQVFFGLQSGKSSDMPVGCVPRNGFQRTECLPLADSPMGLQSEDTAAQNLHGAQGVSRH